MHLLTHCADPIPPAEGVQFDAAPEMPPLPMCLLQFSNSLFDRGLCMKDSGALDGDDSWHRWSFGSVSLDGPSPNSLGEPKISLFSGPRPPPWLKTVIVRGLPERCTQRLIVQQWPPPENSYDFLSLPFNHPQRRSTHYCFINFVSGEAAQKFYHLWHGKNFPGPGGGVRHLDICEWRFQGLGPPTF
mmetsp:Transcript_3488/g.10595  ORF Transcript_3488/g.10595 Transcript_3488/m.10595 type:complete len:187 (+) Transcript_3488:36-596(+)